jgi:carboxypeptidase Taq
MSKRNVQDIASDFKQCIRKIRSYEEALGLLYWDLRTGAPKKGVETRSDAIGVLSSEMFKLSVSKEMGEYLEALREPEAYKELNEIEQRMVSESFKAYEKSKKIPPDMYQEYVVLTSQAESIWEEAKEENNFAKFQPYLEKIVDFNRKFVELWGYEGHPYNTLLEPYEPGMTVEKLDQVFSALRDELVPLLKQIADSSNKPEAGFLQADYPKAQQREFSLYILKQLGYDFDAGRLDESVHPFATGLNPGDVRITTSFLPNEVSFALFGTIHECGHALYEQNISKDLIGTNLCSGASMGIHESQSRFWENKVGSSRPFWQRYLKELKQTFPEQLKDVNEEGFYKAINEVKPSLIRIKADEMTYNLHIIIRYEIEKALISGDLKVADLPQVWNQKYEEYLGITPPTDAEGVLQDVHWAGGAFGYFPSYALGNMYAAQLLNQIREDLPSFNQDIEAGDFSSIKQWLVENIHQYGQLLTPEELIKKATGESLNPKYLTQYLQTKYTDIYSL